MKRRKCEGCKEDCLGKVLMGDDEDADKKDWFCILKDEFVDVKERVEFS